MFGLYAGIIPLAIFALFTSSRHLVAIRMPLFLRLGAVVIGFAPIGDPLRVQYALALALMCGLLFFVFWLFRLAFLANFLSRAVLAGFITGLGIEVLTNQARRILGAAHSIDGSGLAAMAEQLHGAMATSVDTTGYFVELIVLLESQHHGMRYGLQQNDELHKITRSVNGSGHRTMGVARPSHPIPIRLLNEKPQGSAWPGWSTPRSPDR